MRQALIMLVSSPKRQFQQILFPILLHSNVMVGLTIYSYIANCAVCQISKQLANVVSTTPSMSMQGLVHSTGKSHFDLLS